MKYQVIPSGSGNSISAVDLVHKQWTMRWNMTTYTRFKVSDPAVLFHEVNEFWAKQPEKVQDRAMLIYWNIYRILADPNNTLTIVQGAQLSADAENADLNAMYERYLKEDAALPPDYDQNEHGNLLQRETVAKFIAKLYELFTRKDAEDIVANMTIVYASTMTDAKPEVSRQYPDSGRTHTRSDYNALAALAIRLRPVLPIFGHCMHVYQDKRKSGLKESAIVKQLEETDIFEMPAVPKLKDFMEASLKQFKLSSVTTVNGAIGQAELPYWCLAKALYRRVSCGEINSIDGQSSIVTNIFNFIEKSVLESVNRNFGPVSRKSRPDEKSGSKGEDNQSIIESVKAREAIARGRRRMINVYARNVQLIAHRIDPSVPSDLVDNCCKLTPTKLNETLHPVQEGLMRWVMSRAEHRITGVGFHGTLGLHHNIDYLRREELTLYRGITQALLDHWGFSELAALFDATVSVKEGIVPTAAMWAHDDFSPEIVAQLVELFPYEIAGNRKTTAIEERNIGAADAREMTTLISMENWVVRQGRYSEKITVDREGFMVFPPGFANQIASLLIHCCKPNSGVVI